MRQKADLTAHSASRHLAEVGIANATRIIRLCRPRPSSRRSQRCHPTFGASDQAQVLELELAHELLEQCDDGPTMLEVDGHLFEHLALALSLA